MEKEEIEARIEAIEYLIVNDLYIKENAGDIQADLEMLRSKLKEFDKVESEINVEETTTAESILEDRENSYGSFDKFVKHMTAIMNILERHKDTETYLEVETIENFFLVLKMLRLQTAEDSDSLIDLQNYAKLILDRRT